MELRLISIGKRNAQQYNLPTTSEIAGLIVDNPEGDGTRDIIVDEKKSGLKNISELHPSYMALQYPLLFPYGEDSLHTDIPYDKDNTSVRDDELGFEKKRKNITMREYYAFRLQQRSNEGRTLIRGGRLFQQFVVDAYATIEQCRLKWVRCHQEEIRADVFQGIKEAVAAGDTEPGTAGRIILPSTFTGGPRQLGPPDLFITFTCNPKWFEITEALKKIPGQQPIDRPDIVSRVFHIKLKALMSDLEGSRHFGEAQGAIYTVEFQKRGFPHAHIILWLKPEDKPKTAAHVDSIIQAEFPDPEKDRVGYDAVCQYMLHGPCGAVKPNSPCMHHKKCSKKYPKKFCDKTSVDEKGGVSIKYLFKYLHKGSDRVNAILETPATKKKTSNDSDISDPKESTSDVSDTVAPNNKPKPKFDEIKKYLDCRYLSASEAFWRTLNFEIHYRRPCVERLPFHLEGEQLIYHKDTEDLRDVLERTDPDATKFLHWMKANREHVKARNLTYADFPSEWTWDTESKEWKPRKRGFNKIGRIYYVHPTAGEKYYLRILLNVQRGCQSYDDIKTVDCVTHLTFKAACLALGLLEDDGEWDHAIKEAAAIYINGKRLRELFVTLLLNCKVTEPKKLWSENWKLLADGIEHEHQKLYGNENLTYDDDDLKNYALQEIELIMWKCGRTLKEDEFSEIPYPDMSGIDVPRNHLVAEETSYDRINLLAEAESLKRELNIKQKIVFDSVIDSVEKKDGSLFFVCGSGGTGKTYLWRTIISYLRAQGKIVLAVASSGIASLLLPGGRTAHSRFKIPLRLNEQSCYNIFKKTNEADLLCRADLIIWDEAPMMHRNGLEAVQRTLADLMMEKNGGKELFGRKTLVLGGDFRQILPVIEEGSREEIVNASISRSKLWKHFKVFELTDNMRLLTGDTSVQKREEVEEFSKWVLDVGNGKLPTISLDGSKDTDWVEIPSDLLIRCQENHLDTIVRTMYPDLIIHMRDKNYLADRSILAPTNECVHNINSHILACIPGEEHTYLSADYIGPESTEYHSSVIFYDKEFLNKHECSGMASHKLTLKVGVPIMLLRNISQPDGLRNGTKLIVKQLGEKVIKSEILTGPGVGNIVFIPRIVMTTPETSLLFILHRRQFPVRVCYAMTINKSQGQSLPNVGVYVDKPVFTHGQLYVAVSRTTSRKGLKILIKKNDNEPEGYTQNVVYEEIFDNH
ncbi:uncharacterized protein LOC113352060 [Papaver somniferum]|uniref:uncharacterized protein LOC113352060 n=1 Tax=Papaver somniferum TaxID=3469 RepID=UPI000E6FE891|nr:uncharacterized protein LOC113352060 [Papaver somniferum]